MKKNKNLQEQAVSAAKPKGLPAPGDLANRIKSAGMSAEELMSYLGAVMTRASAGASPAPEAPAPEPAPMPEPSPAAIEEKLEESLLYQLLKDVKSHNRRKK